MSAQTRSAALALIALVSLITSSLWWLSATRSAELLERARRFEEAGELRVALERYQWAARAYAPLAEAPQRAFSALLRLAEASRARQDHALQLEALERARGVIWATQGLTAPFSEHAQSVDEQIAWLRAQSSSARSEAEHLKLLQQDPRPSLWVSLLLALGLLGALLSVGAALVWGVDRFLRLTPRFTWCALGFLSSSAVWMWALYLAP